ncbi:hypothetical protein GCK32_018262, partial [Trichostrongylus colubriformis]
MLEEFMCFSTQSESTKDKKQGQFIVESSECGRTKMSSSKKEAFPQASTPTPEFNREKHKLEVKKMKLKKQKRRMK